MTPIYLAIPTGGCTTKPLCLHKLVATTPFVFPFWCFHAHSTAYQYLPSHLKCSVCDCYVMLSLHNNQPIIILTAFGVTFTCLFWSSCCLLSNRLCCSYCICDSNWVNFWIFYSRTPYAARMQFN